MENTFETKLVKIDELNTEGLQIRVALDQTAIAEYAEAMRDGAEFPPVIVFGNYLADGFHRIEAAKCAGRDTILAKVHIGTFDDALKYALGANETHGVRRTNADKRRALEITWEQWDTLYADIERTTDSGRPSKRQLASICGVSNEMARVFCENKRAAITATPRKGSCTNDTHPTTGASATVVTHDHTEERNPETRKNLKKGLDRFGVEIPKALSDAFNGTDLKQNVRTLKRVRKLLLAAQANGDMQLAAVPQSALIDLDNAITALNLARPFCVCRACRGMGCDYCRMLGFQTVMQYRRLPSEYMHHED